MFWNQIKTVILLGILSSILLLLGKLFGGTTGIHIALLFAIIMNGIAYFFSDKIVLRMYNAKPMNINNYPMIHDTVSELARSMHLPMPRLWIIDSPIANAFATGRSPQHASVAVTSGILDTLDAVELRGVLAHELGHVKNRDILVSSIAAVLAGAIGHLAHMLHNMVWWDSMRSDERRKNHNPLFLILISIFIPIIATLIQLAISRSREYLADECGSEYTKNPLALASALKKLEYRAQHTTSFNTKYESAAHLFIVHPCKSGKFKLADLLSTHPPMHKRIARLEALHKKMFSY